MREKKDIVCSVKNLVKYQIDYNLKWMPKWWDIKCRQGHIRKEINVNNSFPSTVKDN